jgi:inosine-uridine nucleoside N-ribohydrolase
MAPSMALPLSRRALVLLCLLSVLAATPLIAAERRVPVIVDTDANNELDDQHALAYALLDPETFAIEGITVNATVGGGEVQRHYDEAARVIALCARTGQVRLALGANASFTEIRPHLQDATYDGKAAVDLIVARARAASPARPLVLVPIGKLTNIALALALAPDIASRVRIVWLGSNYPEPGEYNQDGDPESLRYVLSVDVPFEMVVVRYGKPSGTDAIRVTRADVATRFAGRGPRIQTPVTGRHGGSFTTFGDYSVDLFGHITLDGTPPSRALYDLAALAIVKNPAWARARTHPAPALVGTRWEERPTNTRRITIWEQFDRTAIVGDLQAVLERQTPGSRR